MECAECVLDVGERERKLNKKGRERKTKYIVRSLTSLKNEGGKKKVSQTSTSRLRILV